MNYDAAPHYQFLSLNGRLVYDNEIFNYNVDESNPGYQLVTDLIVGEKNISNVRSLSLFICLEKGIVSVRFSHSDEVDKEYIYKGSKRNIVL